MRKKQLRDHVFSIATELSEVFTFSQLMEKIYDTGAYSNVLTTARVRMFLKAGSYTQLDKGIWRIEWG